MAFRCVQAVVSVANHLSFSEAASELNYSTSAVSKQVAVFEKDVGFEVFKRSTKSAVVLTPEGQAILPTLRDMLDVHGRFKLKVAEINCAKANRLSIAFSPGGVSPLNIEPLVTQYSVKYPETKITLCVMHDLDAFEGMKKGDIDIFAAAIPGNVSCDELFSDIFSPGELTVFPYEQCQISIAMGSDNPLCKKDVLKVEDLRDTHLIHRKLHGSAREQAILNQTRAMFIKGGMTHDFEYIDDSQDAYMLDMIEKSNAVMPMLRVQSMPGRNIVVRPLDTTENPITLCFIYMTDSKSVVTERFVSISNDVCFGKNKEGAL